MAKRPPAATTRDDHFKIVGYTEAWLKSTMVKLLVAPKSSVCEFCCGRGSELKLYARLGARQVLGLEHSEKRLMEAREKAVDAARFARAASPDSVFSCSFIEVDPTRGVVPVPVSKTDSASDVGGRFDAITCFGKLQGSFSSAERASIVLQNVESLLRPGGVFFGTTLDSQTVWNKVQKASVNVASDGNRPVVIKTSLYTLEISRTSASEPHTRDAAAFQAYSTRAKLTLPDGTVQFHSLMHVPVFLEQCSQRGLELVTMQNFVQCYQEWRVPFRAELQAAMVKISQRRGASSAKKPKPQDTHPQAQTHTPGLSAEQLDFLSLFTTFVFRYDGKPQPHT